MLGCQPRLIAAEEPAHGIAGFTCLTIFSFAGWAFGPVVLSIKSARIDTMAAFAAVHSPALPIGEADAVSDFSAYGTKGYGFLSFCHLQAILRC